MDPHEHIRPVAASRKRRITQVAVAATVVLVALWFFWIMGSVPEPTHPPEPLDSALGITPQGVDSTDVGATIDSVDSTTTPAIVPVPADVIDSVRKVPEDTTRLQPAPGLPATAPGKLLIPVVGITAGQLQDTYNDARNEGRVHNAIDIIAPHGSQVVAATDGEIVMLHLSERGGISLYQRCPTGDTIYYYAHLDRYADGVAKGKIARRGDLLGYVGETGNVAPGNPHLHFAIWLVTDPKRYWDGENINPYPLLK